MLPTTRRSVSTASCAWPYLVAVVLLLVSALGRDAEGQIGPSVDDESMSSEGAEAQKPPPITMRMLLEVTIFQIDVLTLELRIGGPTGDRIRTLVEAGERTEETADSVADLAADARFAYANLSFLRGISLGRFLREVQRNAVRATEAGYISPETSGLIVQSLPQWYAFLQGRGIEEGDEMEYFIEGDTLTVHYLSPSDSLLMSTTDVGPERRRSVLGGYFARGSDFREGLLDSLFQSEEQLAANP